MTNTATALLSGYRGSKVHAVDVEEPRNQNRYRLHGDAMSLCGWAVIVGDVEFKDLEFITCRNCAKAARNH